MTQEELDALMNEDIDMDMEEMADETAADAIKEDTEELFNSIDDPDGYRASAVQSWPPPPPTDDNKMVHQLDDVTKESEEKATEIFDLIEGISNDLTDSEDTVEEVNSVLDANIALFETLCTKFPHVEAFKTQLAQNQDAKKKNGSLKDMMETNIDTVMNIMDIMQYQDIHRQKIERVINVMRALSTYMNHLFSSKIDDSKRVTSAVHLPGDSTTDIVNSDDIEALLASFGQK
ncbi:MAG: chemotaxis protein [Epsilonproteobacteria bacterium]|nr:chemotaxis protein [Campylobacterota bacterium]